MEFKVKNEFITLGQLLKACDFISSGAQAKFAVKEMNILVNDEREDRRGRKLYAGDTVIVEGEQNPSEMKISRLRLVHYRNYTDETVEFGDGIQLILR